MGQKVVTWSAQGRDHLLTHVSDHPQPLAHLAYEYAPLMIIGIRGAMEVTSWTGLNATIRNQREQLAPVDLCCPA